MTGALDEFAVLGPLVLERDGVAVPLPTGRPRTLLALLLMAHGVPLSRDRLIDELWGQDPPASAVSALHVHLSRLRGVLGGLLVLEPGGYALAPDRFALDAARFDALLERARSEPEALDLAEQLGTLREALGLFRGEPLADVTAEGALAQWRRALEEKRLQATILRIDLELAAGAAAALVGELEELVTAHPFEERVWGQLMLALYRAGRQADALQAFDRARRTLAAELGLEPGEALARYQRQILEHDPGLAPADAPARAGPRSGDGSAAETPGRSALPRPLTRLVGRVEELAALRELAHDPDVRLITLTGSGGVGKTRLALELAPEMASGQADGAAFVALERITDPVLVAAEIATAVAGRGAGPGADGLTAYLRDRELLLVVDNFEHLLPASGLIAELLAQAPRLQVLATSRRALHIRGEQAFEIEPLEVPDGDEAAAVAASPAAQLFAQCARAADRRFVLGGDVAATVARLCRALDGLPLAIELAAARAQALTPAEIAEQLSRPLAIGGHALRDLPDRQQTLEATIGWSVDLLSPAARALMRSAAVFLGGMTTTALEAVAQAPAGSALDELLDVSLLRRRPGETRLDMRELVRAFALAQLRAAGEEAGARARHRAHFASLVGEACEAFDAGDAPGDVAAPLLADHANLRSALESAIEEGDEPAAVALALGLRPLWLAGMMRQECEELVERLLGRFDVPGEVEVALLRAAGFMVFGPSARAWHRRLADRAAAIGDHETLALATGNLFGQALNARDRQELARLRPSLIALIGPETSPRALGWTHYFLALDAYVDGRLAAATEHAELSRAQADTIGHEFMAASAAGTELLARSARDGTITAGELAEAIALMRRPSVLPLAAFALWLVARYAVAVERPAAVRWLAHAERLAVTLDTELWPESELRDETMAALGLERLDEALAATAPLDHGAALAQAAEWLAGRDPQEVAARTAPAPPAPLIR